MIYFSELKGKKVYTKDQGGVGTLEDLIFMASETPKITKLIIRDLKENKIIVPIEYLNKINRNITLEKDFNLTEISENELYLVKNILDKQIIDLKGNKIVRVNDIAIQDKDGFYIAGVDISPFGILRWLRLEKITAKLLSFFPFAFSAEFLSWADIHPLELTRGQVKLKKEEKRLEKLFPEDLADYLEKTNVTNANKILKILDEKFAADVIGNLNINYQTSLFKQFNLDRCAKIITLIDPDEAVDVLLAMSQKKREQIIELLPDLKKKEIKALIRLSRTPIGELLTTEYLAVQPKDTVSHVMSKIKNETTEFSYFSAIYVLNEKNQLIGVFGPHDLLLQEQSGLVYKFMTQNIIVIHLTTPVEIAVKKMLKYKLSALPVIDMEKQILGIVTIDDVTEYLLEKIK